MERRLVIAYGFYAELEASVRAHSEDGNVAQRVRDIIGLATRRMGMGSSRPLMGSGSGPTRLRTFRYSREASSIIWSMASRQSVLQNTSYSRSVSFCMPPAS